MALPPSYFLGLLTPHTAPPKALDFSALGEVTAAMRQNRQFDRQMEADARNRSLSRHKATQDAMLAERRMAFDKQKHAWTKQKVRADVHKELTPERESGSPEREESAKGIEERYGDGYGEDYGEDPGPRGTHKPGIGNELPEKPATPPAQASPAETPTLNDEEYEWAVNALAEDSEARRAGREGHFSPEERGLLEAAIARTDDEGAALRSPAEVRQEETGEDFETYRDKDGKVGPGGVGLRDQGVSEEYPVPTADPLDQGPVPESRLKGLPQHQSTSPADERKELMRDLVLSRAAGAGPGYEQARANMENTFDAEYDAMLRMPGMTFAKMRDAFMKRFDQDRLRFAKVPGDKNQVHEFDRVAKKDGYMAGDRVLKGRMKDGSGNLRQSYDNLEAMKRYADQVADWRESGNVNGMQYNTMIFRISKIVAPGDRITDADFARMTGLKKWSDQLRNWFYTGTGFNSEAELLEEMRRNGAFANDGSIGMSQGSLKMMDEFLTGEVKHASTIHDRNMSRVRNEYAYATGANNHAYNYGMAQAINGELISMGEEPVYAATPEDVAPMPTPGMSFEDAQKQAKVRLRNLTQTDDVAAAQRYLDAHRASMSPTRIRLVEEAILDARNTQQMNGVSEAGEEVERSRGVVADYLARKKGGM